MELPRYEVTWPSDEWTAAVTVVQPGAPLSFAAYGEGKAEDVFDVTLYGNPGEDRAMADRQESENALRALLDFANVGVAATARPGMTATAELRAKIEGLRARRHEDQLALYVGHVVDPETNQLLGYEAASQLPIAELERLFEEDDYGAAWELFSGEDTEGYEQDEGYLRACDEILRLLA